MTCPRNSARRDRKIPPPAVLVQPIPSYPSVPGGTHAWRVREVAARSLGDRPGICHDLPFETQTLRVALRFPPRLERSVVSGTERTAGAGAVFHRWRRKLRRSMESGHHLSDVGPARSGQRREAHMREPRLEQLPAVGVASQNCLKSSRSGRVPRDILPDAHCGDRCITNAIGRASRSLPRRE